jgi:hypothetical protein
MKLQERIQLAMILPIQGTFEDLVLIKSIKEAIEITAKEVEDFNIMTVAGGTSWNKDGVASDVECAWSERQLKLIVDTLKSTSERQALPIDLVDLYAKLVV